MPPPFGKEAFSRVGLGRHQPCAVSSPASSLSPTPFFVACKMATPLSPGLPTFGTLPWHTWRRKRPGQAPPLCVRSWDAWWWRWVGIHGGQGWCWLGAGSWRAPIWGEALGGFWGTAAAAGDLFFQILSLPWALLAPLCGLQSLSTAPSGVWQGEIQSTPVAGLVFLSFLFCKIYFLALLGAGRVPGAYPKMRPGGDGFLRLAGLQHLQATLETFSSLPGRPNPGSDVEEWPEAPVCPGLGKGKEIPETQEGGACVCVCMWGAGLVLWSGAPHPPRGQAPPTARPEQAGRQAGGQWVELGPLLEGLSLSVCLSACLYVCFFPLGTRWCVF